MRYRREEIRGSRNVGSCDIGRNGDRMSFRSRRRVREDKSGEGVMVRTLAQICQSRYTCLDRRLTSDTFGTLESSENCHFQAVFCDNSSVRLPVSSASTSTLPLCCRDFIPLSNRLSCNSPTYEVLANRAMATIVWIGCWQATCETASRFDVIVRFNQLSLLPSERSCLGRRWEPRILPEE